MTKLEEVLAGAEQSITVRRVYGEPYEKNGVTIIPAARIMGGAGGGGAAEPMAPEADQAAGGRPTGSGVGFGLSGRPAGAYVIRGEEVKWVPAIDINRVLFGMQVVLIVFFLVLRSIAKTRARTTVEIAKAAR
jgi:uncharacterized spore protein YtfJ